MPSLVLFDLDGTLLDESGLPAAMDRTCAVVATRADLDAADLRAANDAVWAARWPQVEDAWMRGGATGADLTAEAWKLTLETCGVDDEAVLRLATTTWAEQALAAHRLYPEVDGVLAALTADGVRTGLVTNGAADLQRAKLDVVGLAGRLDPVVISSEVGERKPDAEVFRIALAMAGVHPAHVLYVGDNLWHDIPGAQEAGIETVWVDRCGRGVPEDAPQPERVVGDLSGVVRAPG